MYQFILIFKHMWDFVFKCMLTSFHFFLGLIKTNIFYLIQVVLVVFTFQKFWCLMIYGTYLFLFNHVEFIHNIINNSVVLMLGYLPRYFAGWDEAYLVPNSPKSLHSSETFPGPWIIQSFDALFNRYTYCLRRLPALSSFAGWVFDEAAYPLLFLMSPLRLASARVFCL